MTESVATLTEQLSSDQLATQISAAETLAGMAEGAQPAIVALVEHCGSTNEDLCNWCTAALEDVGPPTAAQINDLTKLVESSNANVAFWAATLLGRAGSIAKSATAVLTQRSSDDSAPEVQKRAAWALGKIQGA